MKNINMTAVTGIMIITTLVGLFFFYRHLQREKFDYFLNSPGSCIDNKNSVPLTNTIMFYPEIEETTTISDKPGKKLTHIFMDNNVNNNSKYNDGIVYNSMYYTDNTFENTAKGGIRYTQMMPKSC
jgi:hypothetical protein